MNNVNINFIHNIIGDDFFLNLVIYRIFSITQKLCLQTYLHVHILVDLIHVSIEDNLNSKSRDLKFNYSRPPRSIMMLVLCKQKQTLKSHPLIAKRVVLKITINLRVNVKFCTNIIVPLILKFGNGTVQIDNCTVPVYYGTILEIKILTDNIPYYTKRLVLLVVLSNIPLPCVSNYQYQRDLHLCLIIQQLVLINISSQVQFFSRQTIY